MAENFIPKIVYGTGPTTISFRYPPAEDDGEELKPNNKVTTSQSGVDQVSTNFIEAIRKLKFELLDESEYTALELFFRTHAALGKDFKFYEHATEAGFLTYTLDKFGFKPKRRVWKVDQFLYDVELSFRRVVT